jgi:RNA polymerase sigma-70 factor (ECF subfamily)
VPAEKNISKNSTGKGETDSFKAIFEMYYGSLISYGISLTGSQEVSRGLVQDVFLKLWEKQNEGQIQESVKSYLFKAVFNRAANWLRHEKVKRAFEKEGFKGIFDDSTVQHEINPFQTQAIKKSIEELPPKAREAFSLFYLEGLSQKEISEKMNISVKTVENQVSRARKILQKKLKKFR